jgi:two-component sensor histidine kinase
MLAQGGGDEVDFGEVMRPIVRLAEEALVTPDRPVTFVMSGEGPILPTSTASSLAVMLNELLQNAVEHGYPPGSGGGVVSVQLSAIGRELAIVVRDHGVGLPPGFDSATSAGLGLTIISTLMTGDLGGTIEVLPAPEGQGTQAELRVSF